MKTLFVMDPLEAINLAGDSTFMLMREATSPDVLSSISLGVAQVVGGDHTSDAARLLRMPGTNNWKNQEEPILVEIEVLDPARA